MKLVKWEYLTLVLRTGGWMGGKVDGQELTDALNEKGADGWELVSIFDTNMYRGETRDVVAILKRPMAP
ncbi:MAG: DUF4177 domain-containing protein [Verrucomicrobiales bacterium]|nr:DUF4177 domain-containing protein [Verrucomicrobiales bacterium]